MSNFLSNYITHFFLLLFSLYHSLSTSFYTLFSTFCSNFNPFLLQFPKLLTLFFVFPSTLSISPLTSISTHHSYYLLTLTPPSFSQTLTLFILHSLSIHQPLPTLRFPSTVLSYFSLKKLFFFALSFTFNSAYSLQSPTLSFPFLLLPFHLLFHLSYSTPTIWLSY